MTTLVTGATGFIGGNLARALSKRGEDARALVRPAANDLAIHDRKVKQMPGDLLDIDSLRRAITGCDTVYHCAATYSFWSRRPADIYQTNVAGTQNLLNVAREAGVRRVVFTSSVATIGLPSAGAASPRQQLGDEDIPPAPSHLIGHYKQSKYQAEPTAMTLKSWSSTPAPPWGKVGCQANAHRTHSPGLRAAAASPATWPPG